MTAEVHLFPGVEQVKGADPSVIKEDIKRVLAELILKIDTGEIEAEQMFVCIRSRLSGNSSYPYAAVGMTLQSALGLLEIHRNRLIHNHMR